jgi:hypothetical protein
MARRMTDQELTRIAKAAGALASAEHQVEEARIARDDLMLELCSDGVRMSDVLDAIGLTRSAAHSALDRARQRKADR